MFQIVQLVESLSVFRPRQWPTVPRLMRPIILDYQPECRLERMSQNMSPFSPLEMHDSNDIPTSVSLTFLDFRLRLMEPP